MTKRLFSVAVPIVIALFAGCASLRPPRANLVCDHPGVCKVSIKLESCVVVSISNDPIDVYGPNRVIQWEIDPGSDLDYKFDDKYGILIKDDPNGEFTNPAPQGKKFAWHDKNPARNEAQYFAYGINVRDGSGRLCHPVDPGIINHG